MLIGLTYDLKHEYLQQGYTAEQVAEFDRIETIEAIEAVVRAAGHEVSRVGSAPALVQRLAEGQRWDLVFNIAEGVWGSARESQVPAILDVFRIPYTFSDPLTLAACLDKRLAKHLVREHRLPTPDFFVVEQPEDLGRVVLPYPLFVKPIAEGTSRGVTGQSLVHDSSQLYTLTLFLLKAYAQPVLVERYLPGREFTVGIIGTGPAARALGALEVHLFGEADAGVYSYDNKQLFEGRVRYSVASDPEALLAQELALQAYRALGCRDGGRVDMRSDDHGQPCFIEANPLAGLHPEISDLAILGRLTGLPYSDLVTQILSSAIARVRAAAAHP
jgi:D-alanine-D-alanine ligase